MTDAACLCPQSSPDWHDQDVDISAHAAHIQSIASFLFMPLGYENSVQQQSRAITQLELTETYPGLVLTKTGVWGGTLIRLLQTANSAARHVNSLESPFLLRGWLHHGGIDTVKNSTRLLQSKLFDMGRMPKELYICYLTCPICSQAKGGDKILLLRRWVHSKTLSGRLKR